MNARSEPKRPSESSPTTGAPPEVAARTDTSEAATLGTSEVATPGTSEAAGASDTFGAEAAGTAEAEAAGAVDGDVSGGAAPDGALESVPTHPSDPRLGEASVDVARFVDPVAVRRAPKVGAFLGAGVVIGLAIGFCLGGWWLSRGSREVRVTVAGVEQSSTVLNPGAYFALLVISCAAIATLAAGLLAVVLDHWSLRRLQRRQNGTCEVSGDTRAWNRSEDLE